MIIYRILLIESSTNKLSQKVLSIKNVAEIIEKHNELETDTIINTNLSESTEVIRRPFYEFDNQFKKQSNWSDSLNSVFYDSDFKTHPLELKEHSIVIEYIKGYFDTQGVGCQLFICDFGCSTGYMLSKIENELHEPILIGVDIVDSSLVMLHNNKPEYLLFKFDITKIPFPDNFLDCIICLNVLEHIEDDIKALSEFNRVLKPNGIACIAVPYGAKLYDYYDESVLHIRRYGKNELVSKAQSVGFSVVKRRFLNSFMYLPFALKKKINRVIHNKAKDKFDRMQSDVELSCNMFMKVLFNIDNKLSDLIKLPYGIREIVLLRK